MDEQAWLASTDPQAMLEFLREAGAMPDTWEVENRKKWLLACASLHRIQPYEEETNQFIEQTERLVEGQGDYLRWWVLARRFSGLPVLAIGDLGDAILLRDIFNPFRSVTLNPSCLTSTVLALAQSIYDDRAFDLLPILADALEDAGCDNAELVGHLRSGGVHVKGCWALDAVLGKG